jgi:excisionase family DNA binding protein
MTNKIEKVAYNKREAAGYLGVSLYTLMNILNSGKVHFLRAGSRFIIPKKSLDNFLDGKTSRIMSNDEASKSFPEHSGYFKNESVEAVGV